MSKQNHAALKQKKAEEAKKKAEAKAKREAQLSATKAAQAAAATEQQAATTAAATAVVKKSKKRKARESAVDKAVAPAEPGAAPAAALAAARVAEAAEALTTAPGAMAAAAHIAAPAAAPVVPLTKRNKKAIRQQAAFEKQHKALYASGGPTLLVGEGNFSFARALCRVVGSGAQLCATAFDGESVLKRKYPDASECRQEVEEKFGGTTLVGVDATRLHEVREFRHAFRTIAWNFPHIGGGESDVEKSVADHQKLLASFFKSAVRCLSQEEGSSIHIALKSGEPYKSWRIVQTARAACSELEPRTVVTFAPSAWPGYEHRRTVGFDERFSKRDSDELEKGAKVYVFALRRAPTEAAA